MNGGNEMSLRGLMTKYLKLFTVSVFAAVSLAAPPVVVEAPESAGFSAERLKRLDKAMQGYVDRKEVAGAVALIARRGKVVYHKSFGNRVAETQAPMSSDVIFRIASMTKPIVSVALMMLWEEGRFQLRDPVSKFLPEFKEMQIALPPADGVRGPRKLLSPASPITLLHLLTHTAGLANPSRGPARAAYSELRDKRKPDWTIRDYVTKLAELPLNFEPGERWEYGPATDVVGRLVEVLSGHTLDEFLQERIFRPLGMTDTHFYLPREKLPRFAALYRPNDEGKIELQEKPDENSRWVREPHIYFSGAGGLVSTTSDYFRFHQMMLNGGELHGVRILGPRTVRLMTSNHIGNKTVWIRGHGDGFGLGYSVTTAIGQSGLPNSVGTFSWGGAYGTVFFVDPEEKIVGVLMSQIRPYSHLNIRRDFQTLTYQAIID